jgi:hypothetical protein
MQVERLGDKQLQPGMKAEGSFRNGKRTKADYLLEHLNASFRRSWLEE